MITPISVHGVLTYAQYVQWLQDEFRYARQMAFEAAMRCAIGTTRNFKAYAASLSAELRAVTAMSRAEYARAIYEYKEGK
jgi:hypothetical protein